MESHAIKRRLLLELSPELLGLITHHLKPRHVFKLMLTSKEVKSRVDNEHYWERAAVHAVWRHFEAVEIVDCDDKHRKFPKLSGLYDLVNLDLGYYETINEIVRRVRQVTACENDPSSAWRELADAPLSALVRAGEETICREALNFQECHPEYAQQEARTMKDVVKREVSASLREDSSMSAKLRKFQREMDDDIAIPLQSKRYFMRKFGDLFWNVGSNEMEDTDLIDFALLTANF